MHKYIKRKWDKKEKYKNDKYKEIVSTARECLNDTKFKRFRDSFNNWRNDLINEMMAYPVNDPGYKEYIIKKLTQLETLNFLLEGVITQAGENDIPKQGDITNNET